MNFQNVCGCIIVSAGKFKDLFVHRTNLIENEKTSPKLYIYYKKLWQCPLHVRHVIMISTRNISRLDDAVDKRPFL